MTECICLYAIKQEKGKPTVHDARCEVGKRERVALQCEAVAHLASNLAAVCRDSAKWIRSGSMDDLLDLVGAETARQMETLGNELNGMDAVNKDGESLAPVFAEAQRLWPTVESG